MIYLDYTANTPVEPQVLEAFCEAERRFVGNANARHGMGQETAKAIARATTVCAELLNVRPEEVIFNSGASEGNNTAIMEVLLTGCTLPITLLVSPPPMKRGAWVPDDGLVEASRELSGQYKALAERLGLRYADAGEWHIDLTFDGVRFTEEGHMHFAEGLASCLGRIYT